MTYTGNSQTISGQTKYQPAVFPPSSLFFTLPSGSSIVLPAFSDVTKLWQEIGVSIVRSFEFQVRWVEQLYALRRPEEVSWFLQAHPFLVPLLIEAHSRIAEVFGLSSKVILEVVIDSEAIDDRELFAFVRTSLPPDEALSKLDRLDQAWWLDEADRAQGKLCIHVEFG